MDEKKTIKSIATALVSQYGDDAQTVAMLRAAEFAAELNNDEWAKWENLEESGKVKEWAKFEECAKIQERASV